MIQPKARSKTTIGTVTATARVVAETPLLDLLASELDEALEGAPVARRTCSCIARRTLRRRVQPSIVRINDGEVVRVHDIGPDLQLDGEVTPRRRTVGVAENKRAVEAVAAPGI
jgi:hypothetical protein